VTTPHGKFRRLTAGEFGFVRMIFKDATCTSRVKIYNRKWRMFLGMQKNDTAVTPNGNTYYPTELFREDFSIDGPGDAGLQLFMHEMVHVWQYQLGYHVKLSGVFSPNKSRYHYELSEDKRLSDYGMEAQGDLLADYFLLLKFGDLGRMYLSEGEYRCQGCADDLIPRYKAVLVDFLSNPHGEDNLPGRRGKRRSRTNNANPRRGGCQ